MNILANTKRVVKSQFRELGFVAFIVALMIVPANAKVDPQKCSGSISYYKKIPTANGLFCLGIKYFHANKNSHALEAFSKAANKGSVRAMIALGLYNWDGIDQKKDEPAARFWFRKAALKGNTEGMIMLSETLTDSTQIPRDYKRGWMWLEVAKSKGNKEAIARLKRLWWRVYEGEIITGKKYAQNYIKTGKLPPRLKYEH